VAEFGEPRERDRALCKGCIEIEGSIFPIWPWLSAGGGPERTWWYHVKVTMEHVPLEAWNKEGVKLILGDSCIFDRFDRCMLALETSQFLTCWVWMDDPEELPRSLEYTIFAARAGQAMEINSLVAPTRTPSSPPIKMGADKIILIHMAG
jgi:hypothetical protein